MYGEDGQPQSMEDRINLHQLMELKAAFDRADTDGGGSLDLEEFLEVRHSPSTPVSAGSR